MSQWRGKGKDARLSIVSLHLYRPSGRRGAAEVLSRDRWCEPSTRQGARPERLRSRGDCRAWNYFSGRGWMEASSCRGAMDQFHDTARKNPRTTKGTKYHEGF